MNSLKHKNILIIGGSGFIGSHLIEQLINLGAILTSISRKPFSKQFPQVNQFLGNIEDAVFIEQVIQKVQPQIIFHLAANKERSDSLPAFSQAVQTNLLGTLNLVAALKNNPKLERLIVLGTAEEYGNSLAPFCEDQQAAPVSAYSFSKLCTTQLLQTLHRLNRLPVVIIRPSLAYGPGQADNMFLPSLIRTLLASQPFAMTAGDQLRDYLYITDLVQALIQTILAPKLEGEIINIGSGKSVLLKQVAQKVGQLLNREPLIQFGAVAYRNNEIMHYELDIQKAQQLLNWQPQTSLEQGLAQTIATYAK